MRGFSFLLLCFVLLNFTGCQGLGKIMSVKAASVIPVVDGLELLKVVELSSDGVDICVDGRRVLVLEGSGTRVLAFDSEFCAVETIPLSNRLVAPRGIYTDRYYIYVYDDKTLYRLTKDKLEMSVWLNNVRVEGLATFAPGEVLLSDGERQVVWFKTLFGESRIFLDRSEVVNPKAMAVFPNGIFGVLAGMNRLLKVNRAGIVVNSLSVPDRVDLLAVDDKGRAIVMRQSEKTLWVVDEKGVSGYELKEAVNPLALTVKDARLALLDAGRRILIYSVPGK
ncbi:MAG: hypothetical protein ACUVUR_03650 [bacterium]